MTTTHRPSGSPRATATIYQFPVRAPASHERALVAPEGRPPAPATSFGSGWYHDAAIQESDRSRNH